MTNPAISCNTTGGEILLRPNQFCNLSEIVARPDDDLNALKRKARIATLLGTLQSTLTNFRYLRSVWKKNVEEERLLGVSVTGIMDHPVLNGCLGKDALNKWLSELKKEVVNANAEYADALGIERSAATTCVKPSGTVSQLVDAASGIHPRYEPYYIRTVRADVKDPLAVFLQKQGVPCEPDVMKPHVGLVFSFPMKAPKDAIFRNDIKAIEQLEHYLVWKEMYCEHNPSITVYVQEHEWMEVGAWVYKHFDRIGGVSFLPHSEHTYKQAPYQQITEEEYELLISKFPKIEWNKFSEKGDNTTATRELACVSGVCEI